jgi:hypothetical protein
MLANPAALVDIDIVAEIAGIERRLQADRASAKNRDPSRSLDRHADVSG